MYRLSPSKIDQFRMYRNEVFEMEVDDLIDRLTGQSEDTEAMLFGKQVHSFLEDGTVGDLMTEEIEQLIPYRERWSGRVKEQWIEHPLTDNAYLLMRVDMMHGLIIEDIKVAGRFWGVDYYEQSVQWKIYLMATGCDKFIYHIFQKNNKRPYKLAYHTFDFLAYVGMDQEIVGLADGLIRFCEDHNITECITPKRYA